MEARDSHIETEVLHGGYSTEEKTGATVFPIFQSTSFAYGSAEELESIFAGRSPGFVYSRINNPTVDRFERRIAALENGLAAVGCASGMAAINTAVLALAGAGDEIVSGSSIFGGTHSLFTNTLSRCGITTRYVEARDVDAYREAINERTRLVFVETIGNPKLDVPDVAAIADVAREAGVALVVDNTAASPVLCRPKDLGAALVVHSTSKYISGHGTAVGGVIVDCGTFDWAGERYSHLKPFAARAGQFALVASMRQRVHRDTGCCLSPFNAFLSSLGIDSLAVRLDRHCANAAWIADVLSSDARVDAVGYPGLETHPDHAVAEREFGGRYGALLTLRLGSKKRAFAFINALRRVQNLTNLGDVRTLVVHPASTFCRDAGEPERLAMGVTDDLVRVSVGIEHVDDILQDMNQALTAG